MAAPAAAAATRLTQNIFTTEPKGRMTTGPGFLLYHAPRTTVHPVDKVFKALYFRSTEEPGKPLQDLSEIERQGLAAELTHALKNENVQRQGGIEPEDIIETTGGGTAETATRTVSSKYHVDPLPGYFSLSQLYRAIDGTVPSEVVVKIKRKDVHQEFQPRAFTFDVADDFVFTGSHFQGAIAIGVMLSILENAAGTDETVSFDRLFAYMLVSCGVVAIAVVVGHKGLAQYWQNAVGESFITVLG